MLTRIAVVALLTASSAALAEPDAAAKGKIQAMLDALSAAKSISYKVEYKGEGAMLATFAPHGRTTVLMQRNPDNDKVWLYRIEGEAKSALAGQEGTTYLVVGDGVHVAWKDDMAKTVFERVVAAAASPTIDMAKKACAIEMLEAEPVTKAMSAASIAQEKAADVGGATCDVILCDNNDGRARRFFIAPSDHLPRRIEHRITGGGMDDSEVWLLTDIKVNETIPAGSFAISTPEGFVFSPAPQAAAPVVPAPVVTTKDAEGHLTTAPVHQRAVGVNPDDLAPDFELTSGTGEKVKLSSLNGNVVVLDFWGTWCLPCMKASPELQKIANDYKEKTVKIFGLAVRDPVDEKPINYMKDHGYTYGLLLKADEAAKTYHIKAFPTYFVIGKTGEVVYATGLDEKIDTTFAHIRSAIDAALEGRPMPKIEAPPEAAKPDPVPPAKHDAIKDSKGVKGGK